MIVTFLGHRDAPQTVQPLLEAVLADLVENGGAQCFYVGNQGNFDLMVRNALKRLKKKYPHIDCAVVLAYMPTKKTGIDEELATVLPEGVENTPPKYAITKRNRWMIKQADVVVCYVKYTFGGAAQFKTLAEKSGKRIIEISELT